MPFNLTPSGSYTPPTPIVDGASNYIEANDVNSLFTPTNGINTMLTPLGTSKSIVVTAGTTPLFANVETMVYCNTTSGNVTLSLPPASTGNKLPITIKKISTDTNSVIISVFAGDRIEDTGANRLTAPTATTRSFTQPDEAVVLFPSGNTWRVISSHKPNYYTATYFPSGNIAYTGGFSSRVALNTSLFDSTGGWFSTANSRFTPRIAGFYLFTGAVTLVAGASSFANAQLYINSGARLNGTQFGATPDLINSQFTSVELMNGTTDFAEMNIFITANRTVQAGATFTRFTASLIQPI